MPMRLDTKSPEFAVSFDALLAMNREAASDVDQAVQAIIAEVAARGDAALIAYSRKFDRVDLEKLGLIVGGSDIDAAFARCPGDALDALHFAHARIIAFHERQLPQDHRFTDPLGVELGWRWRPVEAAGLYVPG
ncbi:MAG: histidinol dehydrogenase, partial [Methylocella sp.]